MQLHTCGQLPAATGGERWEWSAWLVTDPAPLALRGVERPSLPHRAVPLHYLRTRLGAGRLRPRDRDAI